MKIRLKAYYQLHTFGTANVDEEVNEVKVDRMVYIRLIDGSEITVNHDVVEWIIA